MSGPLVGIIMGSSSRMSAAGRMTDKSESLPMMIPTSAPLTDDPPL